MDINKMQKQLNLKYLTVDTPYGVVEAKEKDLDKINDLINLKNENEFFDYFRLSDNTFTTQKLTREDLIVIRDIIVSKRNILKKEIWG